MQMELLANGVITYYYKTMGGFTTGSTVGIQNAAATVGLTTVYNQAYLKNGLAVRIQNAPDWIRVSETSGTIAAGASRTLGITLDATDLALGSYATELLIGHTGISPASPFTLPVTFGVLTAMRGRSGLRSVGPSVQATLRGTTHTLSRLSIGGEAAGTQRGSRYHLRLR